MDALTRLLDGPRGRGAYLIRARMEPPWGVRIQDQAPVGLVAMLQGAAWIAADTGETVSVSPGDVAIMRGPDPFTFTDDPSTKPQIILHPGQRCTSPEGVDLTDRMDLGRRTWATAATARPRCSWAATSCVARSANVCWQPCPECSVSRRGNWTLR